jgi:hypothetical protein
MLATVGLLGLFVAGSRGYQLPQRLFTQRTWIKAAGWTAVCGTAATVGAAFAGSEEVTGFIAVLTALLLFIEFMLWSDAKSFGPRDP